MKEIRCIIENTNKSKQIFWKINKCVTFLRYIKNKKLKLIIKLTNIKNNNKTCYKWLSANAFEKSDELENYLKKKSKLL